MNTKSNSEVLENDLDVSDSDVLDGDEEENENENLAEDFIVTEDDNLPLPDETSEPAKEEAKKPSELPEDFDFNNPQNLPPELKQYYTGMQAAFTRRQQAVTDALKNLQPHAERLQMLERAQAGDPQAKAYLAAAIGVNPGQGQQPPKQDEPVNVNDFETPAQLIEYMEKKQSAAIQNALKEFTGQLAPHIQKLTEKANEDARIAEESRQKTEYESVKKVHPDFDNYLNEIVKLREQYPGMTMKDAYKLATYQNPAPRTMATPKPGKPSRASEKPKKINSYADAARAALEELKN